jgi:hypothetical protein
VPLRLARSAVKPKALNYLAATVLGIVPTVCPATSSCKGNTTKSEKNIKLLHLGLLVSVAVRQVRNFIGIIVTTAVSIEAGCVTTATRALESSVTISKAS